MSNYLRLRPDQSIVLAVPLVRDVAVSVGRDGSDALHMYAAFDASHDTSRSNVFGVDVVVRSGVVCKPGEFDPAKHDHELHFYHSTAPGPLELTSQMANAIGVVMERNQIVIQDAHNRLMLPTQRYLFRAAMDAVAAALNRY